MIDPVRVLPNDPPMWQEQEANPLVVHRQGQNRQGPGADHNRLNHTESRLSIWHANSSLARKVAVTRTVFTHTIGLRRNPPQHRGRNPVRDDLNIVDERALPKGHRLGRALRNPITADPPRAPQGRDDREGQREVEEAEAPNTEGHEALDRSCVVRRP